MHVVFLYDVLYFCLPEGVYHLCEAFDDCYRVMWNFTARKLQSPFG